MKKRFYDIFIIFLSLILILCIGGYGVCASTVKAATNGVSYSSGTSSTYNKVYDVTNGVYLDSLDRTLKETNFVEGYSRSSFLSSTMIDYDTSKEVVNKYYKLDKTCLNSYIYILNEYNNYALSGVSGGVKSDYTSYGYSKVEVHLYIFVYYTSSSLGDTYFVDTKNVKYVLPNDRNYTCVDITLDEADLQNPDSFKFYFTKIGKLSYINFVFGYYGYNSSLDNSGNLKQVYAVSGNPKQVTNNYDYYYKDDEKTYTDFSYCTPGTYELNYSYGCNVVVDFVNSGYAAVNSLSYVVLTTNVEVTLTQSIYSVDYYDVYYNAYNFLTIDGDYNFDTIKTDTFILCKEKYYQFYNISFPSIDYEELYNNLLVEFEDLSKRYNSLYEEYNNLPSEIEKYQELYQEYLNKVGTLKKELEEKQAELEKYEDIDPADYYSLKNIFYAILESPVAAISYVFTLDLFGINAGAFFVTIMTISIVMFFVKLFIGSHDMIYEEDSKTGKKSFKGFKRKNKHSKVIKKKGDKK